MVYFCQRYLAARKLAPRNDMVKSRKQVLLYLKLLSYFLHECFSTSVNGDVPQLAWHHIHLKNAKKNKKM